jgi:hypothetical protein
VLYRQLNPSAVGHDVRGPDAVVGHGART